MAKRIIKIALIAFIICGAIGAGHAQTYDVTADFSTNSNPNGVWSYGSMETGFLNYQVSSWEASWEAWTASNHYANIWINDSEAIQYQIPSGSVALHPGSSGQPAVIRWTAPDDIGFAQVRIVGEFGPGDQYSPSLSIRQASTTLWSGVNSGSFDETNSVAPGDTIDFCVYGEHEYANTPLDLQITVLTNSSQNADVALSVASLYGTPTPAVGTTSNSWGTVVTCAVENVTSGLTNWSCTGWTGTGSVPASGSSNSIEVTLSEDSSITWNWQTNYWLDVSVSGSGTVDVSDGFYAKDSEQILAATPESGWLFMGWSGDASGTNDEASVTMTEPQAVTATFSDDADGDGLTNTEEASAGSNPWNSDTDGDGFDDKTEVDYGLSPTNDSSGLVTYIEDNDDTFGLYPSNAVLDVAVGEMLMDVVGTEATLNLQLETSEDLQSWTNAGPAKVWSWTVDGEKKFFRVKSSK